MSLAAITDRIVARSRPTRQAYLGRIGSAREAGPRRAALGCSNLAHGMAACGAAEKAMLGGGKGPCIAIVSSYNDILSAHQPFEHFPALIKQAVAEQGGLARFAGGVPAMCDGVTQGMAGMELSLFSRDVIAQSTAVALSHDLFDGALLLGVCDKIVPGLMIGALAFGHLPAIFVPAGPMASGIAHGEKAKIRQAYASGKATRAELLAAESAAYHAPGTCSFYGTANSNQMLMEMMGVHLPGASFVPALSPERDTLTRAAARQVTKLTEFGLGEMLDERSFVNGMVGLLATGGSTNHTIHLPAMARAAGIILDWEDFRDLSKIVPLIARIYPSGAKDVNDFHRAGGLAAVIGELLAAGLLHRDVRTVNGTDLSPYGETAAAGRDPAVIASAGQPFEQDGGLTMLSGNLGRAIAKISAVKPEHRSIEAPCRVFTSQEEVDQAFKAGELQRDLVCVLRFQGPRANGMPELHKLIPPLGALQDLGFRLALVTDGRMSGASGKILSAIHVTPEAAEGGALAKLRDGDVIRIDCAAGVLQVLVSEAELARRSSAPAPETGHWGTGRELFAPFRQAVSPADRGASIFSFDGRS